MSSRPHEVVDFVLLQTKVRHPGDVHVVTVEHALVHGLVSFSLYLVFELDGIVETLSHQSLVVNGCIQPLHDNKSRRRIASTL